jgi:hypothetical protein
MVAATREFIDDTCVNKSVQKSKNDKFTIITEVEIEIDNKRWQQKLAVKVFSLHNHRRRLACLAGPTEFAARSKSH